MLGMTNDRRYLGTKKLRGGFFSLVIGKNREKTGTAPIFQWKKGAVPHFSWLY